MRNKARNDIMSQKALATSLGVIAAVVLVLIFLYISFIPHSSLIPTSTKTTIPMSANTTIPITSNNTTSVTVNTTTSLNTTTTINSTPNTTYSVMNNLSSIRVYNLTTNALIGTYNTYTVNNVSITLNKTYAVPGQEIRVDVLYSGSFNLTEYFMKNTIGVHYFGYHEQGSSTNLVYNNLMNASMYFTQIGQPYVYTPTGLNTSHFLQYTVNVTPTSYAANKTWVFCGGSYVAYAVDGWQNLFNNVTLAGAPVSNASVINKVSANCSTLKVG